MLEFVLSFALIAFCIFLIDRLPVFQHEKIKTSAFKLIFVVKLVAGFVLYLIYTRYYTERATADIFRYFDDADILYRSLFDKPYDYLRMLTGYHADAPDLQHYYDAMRNWYNTEMMFNDTRTMIRFSAFFKLFSMGTYYPHAVLMCFLSMTGLTALFQFFTTFVKGKEMAFLIAVFLMPSTLLWTSGLIKEAFLMYSLGMLLYVLKDMIEKKNALIKNYLLLVFFLYCLFLIKPYIIFLLIPSVILWMLFKRHPRFIFVKTFAVYVTYGVLVMFAAKKLFGMAIPELLANKQAEFFQVAIRDHANSFIDIPVLDSTFTSLIVNTPNAIKNVVLRPTIVEVKNPLMLLAAVENLVIAFFLIVCIYYIYKIKPLPISYWMSIALAFSLTIFVLTGLVTPILGAIVRYKVPALPFFLFAMIHYLPEINLGEKINSLIKKT
ncbi:MAG: hypothetical protein ACKOX3_12110 [Bacteroidota bacterium]